MFQGKNIFSYQFQFNCLQLHKQTQFLEIFCKTLYSVLQINIRNVYTDILFYFLSSNINSFIQTIQQLLYCNQLSRKKSSLMKTLNKKSQLKNLLSGNDTICSTPVSMSSTLNQQSPFGCKKFMRKRDSSTDSLKRSGLGTPKSSQTNLSTTQFIKQKIDKVQQVKFCKIIKSNNQIKLFHSPISVKNDKAIKNSENDPELISPKIYHQKQGIQNQNKTSSIKKSLNRTDDKGYQNYRVLSSNRNFVYSKQQPNLNIFNSALQNYQNMQLPMTERSIQLTQTSYSSQIKILNSELLLFEEQNNRFKKQITQLTLQKQKQTKRRLQAQKQTEKYKNIIKQMRQQQNHLISEIQKQFYEIYMKINRNFTQIKAKQKISLQQFSWSYKIKSLTDSTSIVSQNLKNFIKQFIQPACVTIHKTILNHNKIIDQSILFLNKLQIREGILIKKQFDTKNQIKKINQNYISEKSKVQRYQSMYEKLKKQNKQLKSKCQAEPSKSFKINNENLLGYNINKKLSKQDEINLSYSQCSDQQNNQKQKRKRVDKKA